MRIISQDERTDLPYEEVVTAIPYNDVCRVISSPVPDIVTKPYWDMARYETSEEAMNAMDLLHMAYARGEKIFRFPEHVGEQDVIYFSELFYKNAAKDDYCPNCG